jgi:hypothetical protein
LLGTYTSREGEVEVFKQWRIGVSSVCGSWIFAEKSAILDLDDAACLMPRSACMEDAALLLGDGHSSDHIMF